MLYHQMCLFTSNFTKIRLTAGLYPGPAGILMSFWALTEIGGRNGGKDTERRDRGWKRWKGRS